MTVTTQYGLIEITPDVVASIAGNAAANCFGVKGMTIKNVADGIVRLLKRDAANRGVSVRENKDANTVDIELHIAVEHGININTVCRSIISEVRYNVVRLTGIKVGRVDVFVDSIRVG